MKIKIQSLFLTRSCSSATNSTLIGKRAIITGASRGIGAAIALRFAQEGVQCILVGRNLELLEQQKQLLISAVAVADRPCGEHQVVAGDVGCEELWSQLGKERVDVLVNAAGITHYSPLFVTNTILLQKVIQTNLIGTILGCRTVGKSMLAVREGCIINIASMLGLHGGRGSSAYAASKAGVLGKYKPNLFHHRADIFTVIGLTRSLAAELGERNIRVNVILPGYINTDMTEAMTPENRRLAHEKVPLRRFGTPAEVADAALFLFKNKYANNCAINLDGGLSAT
ncbi:hypothetical protein K3495_g6418 [Podosphaera aphanis]|nr:hypothetical protein K3495_g6418 [Podosphaera aphanis]